MYLQCYNGQTLPYAEVLVNILSYVSVVINPLQTPTPYLVDTGIDLCIFVILCSLVKMFCLHLTECEFFFTDVESLRVLQGDI